MIVRFETKTILREIFMSEAAVYCWMTLGAVITVLAITIVGPRKKEPLAADVAFLKNALEGPAVPFHPYVHRLDLNPTPFGSLKAEAESYKRIACILDP